MVALVFSIPDLADAATFDADSFTDAAAFFAVCIFHTLDLIAIALILLLQISFIKLTSVFLSRLIAELK